MAAELVSGEGSCVELGASRHRNADQRKQVFTQILTMGFHEDMSVG